MENQTKQKSPIKHNRIILFGIFFLSIFALLCILWAFWRNHQLNSEPKIEYVAENKYEKTLYAVTDKDYRPFSYIHEDGSYAGMDVEMIAEVANRLHMNLDLQLLDWDEAQEKLNNGEADVILNMEMDRITEDTGLIGTIPVEEKEYVVYGHNHVASIGELYGTRIGSMQPFTELGLTEEIEFISTYREMFELLEANKLDYILCPLQVGDTFLTQMNLKDIESSFAVKEMFGCIALKSDRVELRDDINEVLREMHHDGVIQKLDTKWIVHYENVTLTGVIRNHPAVFLIFFASLLLIVMFTIVWINDTKHLKIQEGYTEELREKVETIERQNTELEEEKQNAEAANLAKSTFLFNISHDIRTPLNAIIGFAGIAENQADDSEAVRKYMNQISHAGKGLMQMFSDVLDMAQMEDSQIELIPEPCDLSILVPGLGTIMGEEAKQKNQEIEVITKNLNDPVIICDSGRLTQIMINLISNAVKFTPEGGHIQIAIEQMNNDSTDKGSYEFRVKDDGPGINPDFIEKLFLPFEREKNSTQSGQQGTGLGLAIVKKLTDLMGGTITVNSKPNEGSEFIISLEVPVVTTSDDDVEETHSDEDLLKGKNVLLVEDIEINRNIAEMMLMTMGCSVDSAENGAIAVDMVKEKDEPYDLILMDIQMPKMDGYEATRTIRALSDSKLSQIPIIAVTANCLPDDRIAAIESGMNDLVPKPIDPNVLKETMLRQLHG